MSKKSKTACRCEDDKRLVVEDLALDEALLITGERVAVKFVDMLSTVLNEVMSEHSFSIELEYYPQSSEFDSFGPFVGYKIYGLNTQVSALLDRKSIKWQRKYSNDNSSSSS